MALIKSSLLSDIRGSIGGTTYSRTRSGMIARNRTQPVQPNTTAQTEQRQKMMVATDIVSQLTAQDLQDWTDAIVGSGFTEQNAVGDSYVPSAKQLVTQLSLNLQTLGSAPEPDLGKFIAYPNRPSVVANLDSIAVGVGPPVVLSTLDVLVWSGNPTPSDVDVQVAATPPQLASIRNYKKYLRNLRADTAGSESSPATFSLAASYLATYPGINWTDAEGLTIGIAVKAIDTTSGINSAWSYIGKFVIPAAA